MQGLAGWRNGRGQHIMQDLLAYGRRKYQGMHAAGAGGVVQQQMAQGGWRQAEAVQLGLVGSSLAYKGRPTPPLAEFKVVSASPLCIS